MAYFQRHGAPITFLVLSVIGIAISVYLTIAHYANVTLVCSTNGLINCERVTNSIYSYVPGTKIPISAPGLFWFAVSGVLAILAWKVWPERRSIKLIEAVWFGLGVLTALYLVFVEIVYLHAICAWCTFLHAIILIMFLTVIYQLLQGNADEEIYEEENEKQEITVPRVPEHRN